MTRRPRGSVRRSQVITTYGVGGVVAVEDESFMVAGIDRWPDPQPDLHEPRLERELRVQGFVQPPATGDREERDIPVVRFPTVVSCPGCSKLDEYGRLPGQDENRCNYDRTPLITSRFVVC